MTASPNKSNELITYVGMEINALHKQGYSPSQVRHLVSSQLIECCLDTVARKSDGSFDLYALKPLFVAFKFLVDREYAEKSKDSYIPQIQADMARLKAISDYVEHRIEVIKEDSN